MQISSLYPETVSPSRYFPLVAPWHQSAPRYLLRIAPSNVYVCASQSWFFSAELRLVKAHFLRTHYPDVDIPSELIREQLAVESHLEDSYDEFDPYTGQLMASLSYNDGARMHSSFLAFPTGETLNELSELLSLLRFH